MAEWRVSVEGGEWEEVDGESDWGAAEYATEVAVDYWHAHSLDYPGEVRVKVTDPRDVETRWIVDVVAEVAARFNARPDKGVRGT